MCPTGHFFKIKMKQLAEKLTKNGFVYELVKRNDYKAIYSQTTQDGQLLGYEVFRIRKNKQWEMHGKVFPAAETFPTDNDFGITAWSCRTLERAKERYAEIKPAKQHVNI